MTNSVRMISPEAVGAPIGLYSHASEAIGPGRLVFVAGQVGLDSQGQLAGADLESQMVQAVENVRAVLRAAGMSLGDVVKFTTFLARSEDIEQFYAVRARLFPEMFSGEVYPPNTLLVVAGLVRPELLIEIEAAAFARTD